MDVIIKSVGFSAGEQLEGFITDKLQKLDKFDDKIIRIRVTLEKGQEAVENCHCDVRVEVPGYDHYVKKAGESYEAAALEAADTLQTMIKRSKEKQNA